MKQQGFTLIELMITLAVIAIVAGIAAPSFSDMIQDNRLTTTSNELLTGLAITRSEAIKRGERAAICQSDDGSSCSGNASNWHEGWVVYIDEDTDGVIDGDEDIISVHASLSSNMTLSMGASAISYDSDGLATNLSNILYFTLCDDRSDANKQGLAISITGRVRQADTADLASCP